MSDDFDIVSKFEFKKTKIMEKTDNELIAEFMGGSPYGNSGSIGVIYRFDEYDVDVEDLAYHTSWSQLMPVVEKIKYKYVTIGTINQSGINYFRSVLDSKITVSIEILHQRIVRLIKWYNTQNLKEKANETTAF